MTEKAVHKTKDKAVEGPATWANHPTGNALSAGLGAVPVFATKEEAAAAAKDEAEAAGVTPQAVFHVSPDGGSSGEGD